MDLLRTALGEQQVSYYGASYGTLLGATYATLFPERVRHTVLDSPVHPTSWQQRPDACLTREAVVAPPPTGLPCHTQSAVPTPGVRARCRAGLFR